MSVGSIFYIIYCIIVYLEYIPRIVKLIKTKSSNDYSLGSVNLSLVGMFCWVIYVFMTDQELVLYIGSIFDILLNILFAVLVYRYYDKDKE